MGHLLAEIETSPPRSEVDALVCDAANAIRKVGAGERLEQHREPMLDALRDPEAAAVLEAALTHVLLGDSRLLIALRDDLPADLNRAPPGGTILA